MGNNLAIKIPVDTSELAKLALVKSGVADLEKQVKQSAAAIIAAGEQQTEAQRQQLEALAGQLAVQKALYTELQAKIKGVGEETRSMFAKSTEAVEAFNTKLQTVPRFLSAVSELALAGLGIDRAFEVLNQYAETAEMLGHLSAETGLTTEQLSGLSVIVKENGGDFETFQKALPKFAAALQEAATTPTSKAGEAFKAMGISVTDAEGRLRPVADMLQAVSSKLASYSNDTNRAVLETDIFGTKLGAQLTPALLALGEEGFGSAIEKARQLGVLFGEEDVQKSEAFKHAVADLSLEIQGLENTIAKAGAIKWLAGWIGNLNRTVQFISDDDVSRATDLNMKIGVLKQALDSGSIGGDYAGPAQARLKTMTDEYDALIEKIRAANHESNTPPAENKGTPAPAIAKDGAGESAMEGWREQLQQRLLAENKFGADALGEELKYWTGVLALAAKGSKDEADVTGEIFRIRSELAAKSTSLGREAAEAAKRQRDDAWRDYSASMQQQIEAAHGNYAEQERLASDWAAHGAAVYGADTAKFKEASDAKLRIATEAAAAETELGLLRTQQASKLLQTQLQTELDQLGEEVAGGQVAADKKYQIQAELMRRINGLRMQDLLDELATLQTGTRAYQEMVGQIAELAQQSNLDQVKNARESAQAVAAEWQKVNDQFASGFSQTLMDAIEGKKGGIAQAGKKLLQNLLGTGFSDVGKSLAATLEQAIGASGSAPGGLLSSLLGGGGGGAGGILGDLLGGKSLLGGGAQAATETANTAALTTLSASMAISDTSMASLIAALAANTAALAVGSGGGGLSGLTGIAGLLGTPFGFASGGRPPQGVPSIIGERGPELWMPDGAGTIVPNGKFDLGGGGEGGGVNIGRTGDLHLHGIGDITRGGVDKMFRNHGPAIAKHILNTMKNHGVKFARG